MIVFRVAVSVQDDKLDEATEMFVRLSRVSRNIAGVVHFDILQDPADPTRFVSIEVYEDQAALDRQGELDEVGEVMTAFGRLLVAGPNGTIYHVAATEPWPDEPPA